RSPSGTGQRLAWHSGELPLLVRCWIVSRGEPVPQLSVRIRGNTLVARCGVTHPETRHSPCETNDEATGKHQHHTREDSKPAAGNDRHRRILPPAGELETDNGDRDHSATGDHQHPTEQASRPAARGNHSRDGGECQYRDRQQGRRVRSPCLSV